MKPSQLKYIKQFASGVIDFTSQYGGEHPKSFSYSVSNIIGEPYIYPSYGDWTQAAVLRTYGPWWNENRHSDGKSFDKRPRSKPFFSEDYIDLVFEEAVYPWSIAIYETYNPGAVVRILALCQNFPKRKKSESDSDESYPIPMPFKPGCTHWEVLWETSDPKQNIPNVPNEARMFAPILREIKNTTRIIRLELCSTHLDYYTEIDAVELTGTLSYCRTSCVDPPLELVKKLSLSDDIPQHIKNSPSELQVVQFVDNEPKTEFEPTSSSKLEVLIESIPEEIIPNHPYEGLNGNGYFDLLPTELKTYIFSFLPYPDLCNCASVCHLFRTLSYTPTNFSNLDLSSYWSILNDDALYSLKSRCNVANYSKTFSEEDVNNNYGNLQRINLSWYGGGDIASSEMLKEFIMECGTLSLTVLILSSSPAVTDNILSKISDQCPNLEHLDIRSTDKPTPEGIRVLHKLTKLKFINAYRTKIDDAGIICIVHSNKHLEHVNIGSCFKILDYDRVLQEMADHCPNLKSLDCWRAKSLTSLGLNAIARNCNLQDLDFGWCGGLQSSSGCFQILTQNSPNLRKLCVTANRTISNTEISALAQYCPKLQSLDILGTRLVTVHCLEFLLHGCPDLRFLDVSFCSSFTSSVVDRLRRDFPKVSIKRSFQDLN